jgi:hypothetical protein
MRPTIQLLSEQHVTENEEIPNKNESKLTNYKSTSQQKQNNIKEQEKVPLINTRIDSSHSLKKQDSYSAFHKR